LLGYCREASTDFIKEASSWTAYYGRANKTLQLLRVIFAARGCSKAKTADRQTGCSTVHTALKLITSERGGTAVMADKRLIG